MRTLLRLLVFIGLPTILIQLAGCPAPAEDKSFAETRAVASAKPERPAQYVIYHNGYTNLATNVKEDPIEGGGLYTPRVFFTNERGHRVMAIGSYAIELIQ